MDRWGDGSYRKLSSQLSIVSRRQIVFIVKLNELKFTGSMSLQRVVVGSNDEHASD